MSRTTPGAAPTGVSLVVMAAGRATRYGGLKPLAPVGPSGEAIVDVLASDALSAGFDRLVLVVGPGTGPAIRYHVARSWPGDVPVAFAVQEAPRGTVDAVLAAMACLEPERPFGVANADDLPGRVGLELLARHLRSGAPENAAVCFRLRDALLGDAPVTRGVCDVDRDMLRSVHERRSVTATPGGRILSDDGREPAELDADGLVSMNVWGFQPCVRSVLESAMEGAGDGELLLPDLVGELGAAAPVRVLRASGRCVGVTHAADVELVHAVLAREVARGERPAQLWCPVVGAKGA